MGARTTSRWSGTATCIGSSSSTPHTLVDAERDPAAICAAVAAGRVRLVTRPLTWGTAVRLVTGILASSFVLGPRSTQPAEATV